VSVPKLSLLNLNLVVLTGLSSQAQFKSFAKPNFKPLRCYLESVCNKCPLIR